MLDPREIDEKHFSATRRFKEGYSADEVDEFLEEIMRDYAEFHRQIQQLQTELRAERQRKDRPTEADTDPGVSLESVKSILLAAQSTADQIEARAEEEAAQLRVKGSEHAASIINEARAEAEQIVTSANIEVSSRLSGLREQEDRLKASISSLTQREAGYREFLKHALATFAAEMEKDLSEGNPRSTDDHLRRAEGG